MYPEIHAVPDAHSAGYVQNAFIECANRERVEALFEVYEGVYSIYRYAAHLNFPPEHGAPGAVDLNVARDRTRASVVRSAMEIKRDSSSEWPVFKIYYSPSPTAPLRVDAISPGAVNDAPAALNHPLISPERITR